MRRLVWRAVRGVLLRKNTRRIQRDEAIPTGEVQARPAADSSDPSTWDVETVTVHQDVEDINDGREMGVMSSNSSNNVSPAASSGPESPVSHGPGQPGPSSGVSEDDASDASDDPFIWKVTSEGSSPSSSPCSLFSSSPSSSLSSSPSSEDYILDRVNATNLSNCDISTEVVEEIFKDGLEKVKGSSIILAFDYSGTGKVAQEPSIRNLNLHTYKNAVTIIEKHTQLFGGPVQCFGYGDATTLDKNVFSFKHDQGCCNGIEEFYEIFRNIAQCVQKGQSTSLVPIIHTAMDIVYSSGGQHHILIIFTEHSDQVEVEAVVHASFCALSIVVVGVGDGPWLEMQHSIANLPLPCDCCICKRRVIKYPVVFSCNHTMCMKCLQGMG